MSYMALYRTYRPRTFDEMIGQNENVTILKNQISMNKIAHAYLFSGTRGTGKTSAAKIFAKGVNCLQPKEGEPCNVCEVCKNIQSQKVTDIIEIDAASNRGVDEIRDLREKVKYLPVLGRYKVYIVDEVHMLTTEAFNALLKTLEEPPSHCIFILATTEPEKLPATILSRCQRYHFKRISTENIMERMQWICRDGQFEVDDEALRLIAVSADGAMRDALSILDQCLSITQQQRITKEHVKKMLGITDQTLVDGIADAVFRRDANEALRKLDQAYSYGKDMGLLVSQLIETFRDMLVFHITQEDEMVKVLKEDPFGLKEKMQKEDYDRVGRIIELLTERESKMKYTTLPKVLMEVTLVKLITEVGGKGPVGPAEKNPPRSIPSAEPRAQASPKTPPKAPPASTNRKENPSALQAQELVETIGRQKRILGMSLRTANAVVKEQTVVFTYETAHKFHYDQAMKEAAWIQKTAKDLWGEGAKVELLLEEEKQENVAEKWAHEIFDPDKIQVK